MRKITRMRKNRNRRAKEYLKSILRAFILLLTNVLELLVYLLVNVLKVAYKVIYRLNTIIGNLFMKLPRATRTLIIYVLVLTFALDLTGIIQGKKIIKVVEAKTFNAIVPVAKAEPQEEKKEEPKCKFDEISCKIYDKALNVGMTHEQALISISISKWETGNYTSVAFKEKNNVGGMMCQSGLINYSTLDEGIEKFLINLKNNYFDIGLTTLEKIKPKYCPDNAKNDPNGLNQYWLNGTNKMLEELKRY